MIAYDELCRALERQRLGTTGVEAANAASSFALSEVRVADSETSEIELGDVLHDDESL